MSQVDDALFTGPDLELPEECVKVAVLICANGEGEAIELFRERTKIEEQGY